MMIAGLAVFVFIFDEKNRGIVLNMSKLSRSRDRWSILYKHYEFSHKQCFL